MGTVSCNSCYGEVSESAPICPHCGQPKPWQNGYQGLYAGMLAQTQQWMGAGQKYELTAADQDEMERDLQRRMAATRAETERRLKEQTEGKSEKQKTTEWDQHDKFASMFAKFFSPKDNPTY